MAYSLKLVNEVLRICRQERVGGVDDDDTLAMRARTVIDAYDLSYGAFLMDLQPIEAVTRTAISPLSLGAGVPTDATYARRHPMPEDALGLAGDPACLDYDIAVELVSGAERTLLRSNSAAAIEIAYVRRVAPDALSPVAFKGAALALASDVVWVLTSDLEVTRDVRSQLKEWRARNLGRKNQTSRGKPVRIHSMDRVRFG